MLEVGRTGMTSAAALQALERAQEKEAAAQAAGAKATRAQQQAEQLAAEVDVLSAEVAELRADAETRGAAVEGLHATLERIERVTAEQTGPVRQAGLHAARFWLVRSL